MSISDTIEAATKAVGSQKALAALLGIPESHISGFKKGRPCSYQKHAQIAAAAGLEEEARRILIEGIADQLDEKIPHEAEAKAGFLAMLKAFPKS
jgi:DNA-binding transcriptional regulator YdaS (Cro superfamily)